jgi:tetratricopeptide (TPR) repeat protein
MGPWLSGSHSRARLLSLTAAVVLLIVGLTLLARIARKQRVELATPAEPASPYRNVRADVRYLGDAACASCHPHISETYHRHPMGRDVSLVSAHAPLEPLGPAVHNPFEKYGFQFRARLQGADLLNEILAPDAQGRFVVERADPVRFAIGSGARGRTYIIERDGYLFQSPISWYSQTKVWDLTPGFSRSQLAPQPAEPKCLFCHSNHAEPVPDTVNRYEHPLENATTIGCERCHGPGQLHVERQNRGEGYEGFDDSIVNPARLEPTLREAICQQCHLTAGWVVARRGHELFDYRPGLPLQNYLSAFVKPPRLARDYRNASRVEQMAVSRCFQASNGKLGCISCHDPHVKPADTERVAFYRGRCLRCHQEQSCSLPLATRRNKNRTDSCIGCHMPRLSSRKAVHITDTDHRILRRPDAGAHQEQQPLQPGEPLLVSFHAGLPGPGAEEVERDLAVALIEVAHTVQPLREHASQLALPLLEKAVKRCPEDAVAWQSRGMAMAYLGFPRQGLMDLEAALARSPRHETALEDAAKLATGLGERKTALAYWRRLLAVDPWSATAQASVAELLVRSRDWPQAVQACRAALSLDPTQLNTRTFLVSCLIQMGQTNQARAEFAALMPLKPPNEEELRRWFAEQFPASR